jgi:hypothetical protein
MRRKPGNAAVDDPLSQGIRKSIETSSASGVPPATAASIAAATAASANLIASPLTAGAPPGLATYSNLSRDSNTSCCSNASATGNTTTIASEYEQEAELVRKQTGVLLQLMTAPLQWDAKAAAATAAAVGQGLNAISGGARAPMGSAAAAGGGAGGDHGSNKTSLGVSPELEAARELLMVQVGFLSSAERVHVSGSI